MDKQISSGLKNLFLIHFIVGMLFGLTFLLFPVLYGNVLNWTLKDPAAFRIIGAAMVGISSTSWFAYKNPIWDKVRIVVLMEIIWTVLAALATVWGIYFEGFPLVAWMNAILMAIFAVLFFLFYRKEQ